MCLKNKVFHECGVEDDRCSCGEHQWCRECEYRLCGECAPEDDVASVEEYRREFFAYYEQWPNEY